MIYHTCKKKFLLFDHRFILTCLGVGIAACLSTVVGHMVANCISHSTLCIVSFWWASLPHIRYPCSEKILLNDNWNFLSGGFGFHCVLSEGKKKKKKTHFIYTTLIIFVFHFTRWCISYDFIEFYLYFFYYSYSLAHQVSPQLGFSTLSQSSPSFYLNLLWLLQYSSGWTGKWYAFTRLFR